MNMPIYAIENSFHKQTKVKCSTVSALQNFTCQFFYYRQYGIILVDFNSSWLIYR